MKCKFKETFDSLINEVSYKKRIETIKGMYGEQHGATISELLDAAKTASDELKKIDAQKGVSKEEKHALKEEVRQRKLDAMMEVIKNVDYDIPQDSNECELEFVTGNSKVGDDTIIINMGPATACDAAADGQCEFYKMGFCYAQNNEATHPEALVRRYQEKLQWKTMDPDVMGAQLAKAIIKLKRVKYVRFNESGDFKTKADKTKLGEVVVATNKFLAAEGKPPVIFYTYTHRSDLFPNGNDIGVPNLIIQGSGFFKDKKGKNTSKPFFVDNCFIGIDYPNLVNLVRNGDFTEITETLGIEFEGAVSKKIVICRGACLNCPFCKKKGPYIILVCYHGSGSKLTTVAKKMTADIEDMYKAAALEQLDAMNFPEEIKQELFNMTHFNENELVEKLLSYAKYSTRSKTGPDGKKIWFSPRVNPDSILPFIQYVRDNYQTQLKSITGPKGELVSRPVSKYLTGKRGVVADRDIQRHIDKVKKYNLKKQAEFAESGMVPESCFDHSVAEVLEEKKEKKIDLSKLSMLELANKAVANLLATMKGFVSPITVQNLVDANDYDMDVITGEVDLGDESI